VTLKKRAQDPHDKTGHNARNDESGTCRSKMEEVTMKDQAFLNEMAREGAVAFKAGRLDRRSFLMLCGMAGVATLAVRAGDAEAAANEIVMWNWGGESEKCHGDAIGKPFTAATGLPLKFDTSGPLQGKIKEMVDSGKVTADVCDAWLDRERARRRWRGEGQGLSVRHSACDREDQGNQGRQPLLGLRLRSA
jgi:hypothetical protein